MAVIAADELGGWEEVAVFLSISDLDLLDGGQVGRCCDGGTVGIRMLH